MLDERLVDAVAEVFGLRPEEVTPACSSQNVAGWSSVAHLRLVLLVEESFGLRFPTAEIPNLTSVGNIQEVLQRLQKAISDRAGRD
jgi:acyl carrier protein